MLPPRSPVRFLRDKTGIDLSEYVPTLTRHQEGWLQMLKHMSISNALNIMVVRMQNVDYPHNRSFRKTFKELILHDRFSMFYKGLVPIALACTQLLFVGEAMSLSLYFDSTSYKLLWPFVFMAGCLSVHPLMLIGMRVQCAHFAKTPKLRAAYHNSYSTFKHIMRTEGIRGFYAGFGPALLAYTLMAYQQIYFCFRMSFNQQWSFMDEQWRKGLEAYL